ncbi:hypothetical protein M422DRAFT_261009 [Sphaerobolus stellatus SS14]|nr:hypothetical protein M422DRAFT_261009 [Sphaerobolus stellatus SS14]
MSYNVTQRRRKHSYLDDLESFYYVFCWLICGYNGPRDSRVKTPDALKALESKDGGESKLLHLQNPFDLPVQSWFGPSIHELAVQLHDFCQSRLEASGPCPDADRDYAEYLGHIKDTIVNLAPEEEANFGNEDTAKLAAIENLATEFFRKRKIGEMDIDMEEPERKRPVWSQVAGNIEPPRRSKRLSRAQVGTKRKRRK